MVYDLLIKGGSIVDPVAGTTTAGDIAVTGGRISAIAPSLAENDANQIVDARGLLVVPGLVDLHVHVWSGVAELAIDNDPNHLARGTTTVVDAGSSGSNTFRGFRRYVMDSSATRTLAFLHISGMGQLDLEIGELEDIRWARVDRAIQTAQKHPDHIVGIKLRLSTVLVASNARIAFDRAHEATQAIRKPLMLHIGGIVDGTFMLEDALARLRPGDIVTHSFTGWPPGIVDNTGHVIDAALDARRRGVIFDVGHGAGSFSFRVAEAALADGFAPNTISSDLHIGNINGPVYDLVTTLSKFLLLGLSVEEVIAMATHRPASAIGRRDLGTLKVGGIADISLLRLVDGQFTLKDSRGDTREATRRLEPVATVRAGTLSTPSPWQGGT
ncbi:MAG: amidohydrolase/deacetylase family metallohydrolase [Candidatus Limnocylindrales bacterium]